MRKKGYNKIAAVVLIAAFWLAVWQAASLAVNNPLYLPAPAETAAALSALVSTGGFWISVMFTLLRVILGLSISFVSGIAFAYLASRSRTVLNLLRPFVAAVKSTPVVSVIVLALVYFNSSFVPVFTCVLMCFPIFYTNTLSGIRSIDKNLLEMAAVFKISAKRVFTGIGIPSVMPHVYSALSVCLGFSWKSVVAAEVISTTRYSMGYNLYATKLYLDTAGLFAWTVAIIIISLAIERLMKRALPKGGSL